MKRHLTFFWVFFLILPITFFTVACATKSGSSTSSVMAEEPVPSTSDGDADRARIEAERLREQQEREKAAQLAAAQSKFVNEDIYFEFDSSAVIPTAQKALNDKADYMRAHPVIKVTVEGHCDDRGTDAYNLALGQRRADAAKDYLLKLGIQANRLATISYGEERPVDPGHNEAAWAKNRRAHFVIN